MCGRVVSTHPRHLLAEHFDAEAVEGPEPPPSYNAAPGAMVHVVAEGSHGTRVGAMRWGLVPPWSDDPQRGPRPINARVETLLDKALFADAMHGGRRCLVAVSGFFEFMSSPEGKQPYLFTAPDGHPLAMAGLWSRWSRPGSEPVVTCTIITTTANAEVSPLHDRMPALLARHQWSRWLGRNSREVEGLTAMLGPAPVGRLVVRPVSRRVNDARNDDPALLSA